MNAAKAIRTLRKFIDNERAMRERVFRDTRDPRFLERKLRDCDGAAAALEYLARQLDAIEPEAVTLPLFD